jgi:hypothetical protein
MSNAGMSSAAVFNILLKNWRVSPHCRVVNLVRSGRKQPQLLTVSAGGKARLLFGMWSSNEKDRYQYSSNYDINKPKQSIKRNQVRSTLKF